MCDTRAHQRVSTGQKRMKYRMTVLLSLDRCQVSTVEAGWKDQRKSDLVGTFGM